MFYSNQRVFDIFVSSTKRDLSDHRKIIFDEIWKAGHRPIGMEGFPATYKDSQDFIGGQIRQSDLFFLVLGKTYGTPVGDKSFVDFEYRTALNNGKDVIAFVPSDEDVLESELPDSLLELRDELLGSRKIVQLYSFSDEVGFREKVADCVRTSTHELEQDERGGWVRSELLKRTISAGKVLLQVNRSPMLKSLIRPLAETTEMFPNIDNDLDEKESLGRYLWRSMGVAVTATNGVRRMYFDGGSTTFHLCRMFNAYCGQQQSYVYHKAHEKLTIGTNSIVNFLELTLNIEGAVAPYCTLDLFPAPPVSETFGKTFGQLAKITPESIYNYSAREWTLREGVKKELSKVVEEFSAWLKKDGGLNLTILSAAGLAIDEDHPGPWVKSHESMLQQQCIYRSKEAALLVIDGAKWNKRSRDNNGYPILFDGIDWKDVVSQKPFGVAVATFIEEKADEIEQYFRDIKMEVRRDKALENSEPRQLYRLLAFNTKFKGFVCS